MNENNIVLQSKNNNMAQQKGHTGNPNGRPKGTPNKVTTTVRNWIVKIINDNRRKVEQDLQSLKPIERLDFISKLLPYILPKVERADEVEGAAFAKDDIVKNGKTGKAALVTWVEIAGKDRQDESDGDMLLEYLTEDEKMRFVNILQDAEHRKYMKEHYGEDWHTQHI